MTSVIVQKIQDWFWPEGSLEKPLTAEEKAEILSERLNAAFGAEEAELLDTLANLAQNVCGKSDCHCVSQAAEIDEAIQDYVLTKITSYNS